ncbi:SpoIIE family protein phosphatase [Actinoplanes sp. NPDC049548]|uniref:ATP-binding SpoIIE family protein phosphatase n=1 Tax=Actinoplanes sp. NPDC049548 TaxID=3155152 RepID=UPI00343B8ECA
MVTAGAGTPPDAELLAMLDSDTQGWVLARAVRDAGRIVDFEIIYINDAGCRLSGRSRSELVGGRYRELWPETVHDGTLPLYRSVVETRRPATRTVYYDRATVAGHFEFWIGPYGDGFGVRFVDLRQVTVTPQSAGGTRLYDMLDAAFDGFTLLRPIRDDAGEIVDFGCEYVNQIGAKLTGRSVEDVVGKRLSEVSPDAWSDGQFERYCMVADSGETCRVELTYPEISQTWEVNIGRASSGFVAVSFREVTQEHDRQQQLTLSVARAEEAAARASTLQKVTTTLVAASTTAEVYAAIGAVLRPSAGGQGLALLLLNDGQLRLQYHAGYEPDVVEELRRLPLDHPYPATAVARTGRPRYLTSITEFEAAQPDPAVAVPRGGRQAWAFLPLAVAGEVLGTLVVGYTQPRTFDAEERDTLTALAGLSAQALQRALLFEARTSMAAALQRALLPAELPQIEGLRHAARYLPWSHGIDVGGDWYDVIALGNGVVGVVIGDIAGHSAAAAATMGQVRNALRAYATERHTPAGVLHHANQLLLDLHLDTIATCCYLELHLTEGTVTAVLAGHLPPVLRTGSTSAILELRRGIPLGVSRTAVFPETTFVLPPGANLVLYTDGLVEDHRHPIDQGLDELCEALRGAPSQSPDAILDHLLSSPVGPQPRSDDVAVLCLTNDAPAPCPPTARRRFRGEAISASAARRFAGDLLAAWHQQPIAADALLLLDEVVTNAIQHTVGDVLVELRLEQELLVAVSDSSERTPQQRRPDADSENGRGLQIIDHLASAWGTEPLPGGGKRVWFRLPLAG